jgi:hypothetical protein
MKARYTLWFLVVVWALAGSKRAVLPLARAAGPAQPLALGRAEATARLAAHCPPRRAILELGTRGSGAWSAESLTNVRN